MAAFAAADRHFAREATWVCLSHGTVDYEARVELALNKNPLVMWAPVLSATPKELAPPRISKYAPFKVSS